MRISNKVLHNNFLKNLFDRQERISELQKQLSSGKQFDRPSENVIGSSHSIVLNKMISLNDRLVKNIEYADEINKNSDIALESINEALQRARELALRASNEALNEQSMFALYEEAEGILEKVIEVGNSNPGGTYIWGGFKTDRPPFQVNKDIVISGTDPEGTNILGLNLLQGTNSDKIETISSGAIEAGAIALPTQSLVINGIDIGSFNNADTTRTRFQNAQTLIDLINAKTSQTGVIARMINPDTGSFSSSNLTTAGANFGIALSNQVVMQGGNGFVSAALGNLNVGDLVINGVDIADFSDGVINGAGVVALPGGTSQANVNAIVNAINNAATLTKVTATFDFDPANPNNRKLILNTQEPEFTMRTSAAGHGFINFQGAAGTDTYTNTNNYPLEQEIKISGTDNGTITKLKNGNVSLSTINTFSNNLVTAGAYAINAGDIVISDENGFAYNVGSVNCTGTAEQNAQAIANAINNISGQTGVFSNTNGAGRLVLSSPLGKNFRVTTAFNGNNANITNSWYRHFQGGVIQENLITLGKGSLIINGIDIFNETKTFNLPTGYGNADSIAREINQKSQQTGVLATAVDLGDIDGDGFNEGSLVFGNTTTKITNVKYIGDTGENYAAIGMSEKLPLNISGDQAFSGNQSVVQRMGESDIPAGAPLTLAALNLQINGVDIGAVAAPTTAPGPAQQQANLTALINAINAQSVITGVTAKVDSSGTRVILYTRGQDIQINSNDSATLLLQTGLRTGTTDNNLSVFQALIRLRDQISNLKDSRDPPMNISQVNLKEIDQSLENIVLNRAELGVRGERLEMTTNRLNNTNLTLKGQLSNIEDTDMSKTISEFTFEDTIYRAALGVAGRILPQTLLDFLR